MLLFVVGCRWTGLTKDRIEEEMRKTQSSFAHQPRFAWSCLFLTLFAENKATGMLFAPAGRWRMPEE